MIQQLEEQLQKQPHTWLVTGAAGFIGFNLCQHLLQLGQQVRGLDSLVEGLQENADELMSQFPQKFQFIKGDIQNLEVCEQACEGMDYVLHEAALGSVPRSIDNPINSHGSNVTGTLNMFWAAHNKKVKKIVFASSSSVYGDSEILPKEESVIGKPLSPYAATKLMTEIYADVFTKSYGLPAIGLRYFNVFGPKQRPKGPYAAVIPRWLSAMVNGEAVEIFGDGETSRDFCYVRNVIQLNLLAATSRNDKALNQIFNVAVGGQTTLNELFSKLRDALRELQPSVNVPEPIYKDFRPGDVRHSRADISKAQELLGYEPKFDIVAGIKETVAYYLDRS